MKQAVYLKISGTVQGVYFRQSTKEKALELNISGWVRNCNDGSVELEAEGEDADLKNFIEWCYHGPAASIVRGVEIKTIAVNSFVGFEIRR